MDLSEFKKKIRNLTPDRTLVYHVGDLGRDRQRSDMVNKVGAFALAVDDCGFGAIFQRKVPGGGHSYELRVFRRLGMRKDQNGSFQECERIASGHALRVELIRGGEGERHER